MFLIGFGSAMTQSCRCSAGAGEKKRRSLQRALSECYLLPTTYYLLDPGGRSQLRHQPAPSCTCQLPAERLTSLLERPNGLLERPKAFLERPKGFLERPKAFLEVQAPLPEIQARLLFRKSRPGFYTLLATR